MVFPDSPRVLYDQNPLETVICQVRFPPILRIDAEPPVAFQEAVRNEYPLLEERPARDAMLAGLPQELAKAIGEAFAQVLPAANRQFLFSTADRLWRLDLAREFLALTAQEYERWEDFRQRFTSALDALIECYTPGFFTRIGLRYRNVIVRSELGLGTRPWRELLKPHIAGVLSSSDVGDRVEQALHSVVIPAEDGARVQIQHGLARHKPSGEQVYLIDADFYTEQRTEVPDAAQALDRFNREAGRLFRWCIQDRLHDAMEPRAL